MAASAGNRIHSLDGLRRIAPLVIVLFHIDLFLGPLGVEEQFYLAWPFVVKALPARTLKRLTLGLVVASPRELPARGRVGMSAAARPG
jgi:peptidoglycan/LPS O-acetylase OafA/YrhL